MSTLYVVSTPIGNLEDITLRAIRVLREAAHVAAEDTRHTRELLGHLQIPGGSLLSIHAHSTERDVERVVSHLARGETVALVSDAGTPLLSDPGEALVVAAVRAGVPVVPVPGASALLAGLVGSALPMFGGFRFFGFLPRTSPAYPNAVADLARTSCVCVFYESPNRLSGTLAALAEVAPSRPCVVGRELTKKFEEYVRGTVAELARRPEAWRGEAVVMLGAYDGPAVDEVDDTSLDRAIDQHLQQGTHPRTAADLLSAWTGRSKRDVYARIVGRKKTPPSRS